MSAKPTQSSGPANVTELLLDRGAKPVELVLPRYRPEELILGQVAGFDESGYALVTWPGDLPPFAADHCAGVYTTSFSFTK